MSDRIARECHGCHVTDTHAHHVQYAALTHPVTKEPIDFSVSKHIQCCASDGCEICATDVEFAPDTSIGDGFTAYMQAKTDEHHAALTERHGILTPLSVVSAAEAIVEGA
jgi:hypothetical protein